MFNEEAEGRMVLAQLEKISKLSAALMEKISDSDDLEGWVQNKIDLAEDYVQTVYDYLTYNADSVSEEVTNEDLRNWFSKTHPKGNWVRIGTDGEIKGDCAREEGEGKPKCLPKQKAQSMSKEARAKAARRKRREDPQADRPGTGNKPINVKTEEVQYLEEKNTPTNPKLWARAKALAKQKFDVYPCVTLDTLAVTKNGPESYQNLKVGDEILSYNIKNDELEWKPILNIHFYENAPLLEIGKSTGFRVKCTPNHKWVVRTNSNIKDQLIETNKLNKNMDIICCATLNNNNNLLIENWSKKDSWVEKVLLMSKEQREIFLASAIIYDGHDKGVSTKINNRHTFGFSQKNEDHFFATILAAFLNGYHVSYSEKDTDMLSASIIRNKKTHNTQNLLVREINSEDVWCPETENETWVMIQNGFMTITGNSAYANGWAAKWYKSKGGSWKTKSEEFVQEKKMKSFAEFKNTLNECACENVIVEKSPDDPEIEKWIKSNKARFKKEYGEKKGTEVLYAKAWDMYNKKHKK